MTSRAELSRVDTTAIAVQSRSRSHGPTRARREKRRRRAMTVFSVLAVGGFVAAYIGPMSASMPQAFAEEVPPVSLYVSTISDAQAYVAAGEQDAPDLGRSDVTYAVYVKPKPTPTPTPSATASAASQAGGGSSSGRWAPPFVTPNPGSAQAIAYEMVAARGWGEDQFACLVALWKKESGWRVNAYNRSSGAYGIPQSLPGRKMASAGDDWETNPATQITWGLGYISGRYGTPCGAWGHSQRVGWY